jgi:two-component system, NtrC family, sensor kinase
MRRRSRTGTKLVKTRRKQAARKRGNAPKIAIRRSPPTGKETEVARLTRELHERQEQQRATSEILGLVARSRTDVQSVLDIVCQSAAQLCKAYDAAIWRPNGDQLLLAAHHGPINQIESVPLVRGSILGLSILDKRTVHIADLQTQAKEFPVTSEHARRLGFRTGLIVPLMREGIAIGVIAVRRVESLLFTERQVALLQTFADQAVIAIENTRLLNELRQSLQQQTATAEVLKTISRSTFNLKTVLKTLVESAVRLCDGYDAVILLREGKSLTFGAHHGPIPMDFVKWPLTRNWTAGRAVIDKKPIHIHDLTAAGDAFPDGHAMALRLGHRTILSVPLLRENEAIGSLSVRRSEVRPFTDKQIELIETFADQAVIAIENVRLFDEVQERTRSLSESLEQQTASAEVLRIISSSSGDLRPVFDAMLASALRICDAKFGNLWLREGKQFRIVADLGGTQEYHDQLFSEPLLTPDPRSAMGQIAEARDAVQIEDISEAPTHGMKMRAATVEIMKGRTLVGVPMLKNNEVAGIIAIYRQEVRPFTEKHIELVKIFADQAVIAIENARLLNELRESLEQQTATSEVLSVISSSPTDVKPVFDSIAKSAVRLCEGQFSFVIRLDGKVMNFASCFGLNADGLDVFRGLFPRPASDDTVSGRAILQRMVVQVPDVEIDPAYGVQSRRLARTVNYRSIVAVPLLHEGNPIGAIAVARAYAGSFPERQIALLQAFADQGVIAIRNVRLFDEVQARTDQLSESLQQQTATADVLKVISSSPGELEPVFQSMLQNAVRICDAAFGMLFRFEENAWRAAAMFGVPTAFAEFWRQGPQRPGARTALGRVSQTRQTVHIADVTTEPAYIEGEPILVAAVRTILNIPMLKDDELVGAIAIYRKEVAPFTEKQTELLTNFAAQAVIAIENTRLLTELRESLQRQTATADVLKAISRSTFDLNTVLQTLVEAAARLCEADQGTIAREHEGVFVRAATYGFSAEFTDYVTHIPVERERGSATGRALLEGRTVHIPDVQSDLDYTFSKAKELGGFRTILAVPMLRDNVAIGVLALTRINVRPFTDKQIELVTTFADQAAIAIENVRLFEAAEARTRELAKSLEELRTAQDRLVQTQKLASLGQLTAGIAHEIKNPLNFVNNFSGVSTELLDELKETIGHVTFDEATHSEVTELIDTLRGNLEKIVQHGKRADSIVKNMLLHSREGSGDHRPVDINVVVEESLNLAYHGARAEKQGFNITLERSFDPSAGQVDLFPQEITRVFLNLISNGFYAATKRKAQSNDQSYEPVLTAATKNLGDRVEVIIRDNGTGIPPEVRERIFNPFFTTKPAGEGTGLGLSLSHDIVVKQHSGVIEVESQPGEFTEFRIVLPRTAAVIAKTGGQA